MRFAEAWKTFDAPWEELRRAVTAVTEALPLKKQEWSKQGQVLKGRMPFRFPDCWLAPAQVLTVAIDKSGEVWVQITAYSRSLTTDFGLTRNAVRRVMELIEREVARRAA